MGRPRKQKTKANGAANAAPLVAVKMITGLIGKDISVQAGSLVEMPKARAMAFIKEGFARPATAEEMKETAILYK